MRPTGGNLEKLHPRLNVALTTTEERGPLAQALGRGGLVVDRARLDEGAASAAERRRHAEAGAVETIEQELRALDGRCTSAEMALADLIAEQNRLRDAADWCDLQPEQDARAADQIETLTTDIGAHSRAAREATRRLERVLEQRAAAEAALEEARRELTGLGATGIDETDVRRQMERASQDLRTASTEYQQAMTEVARRRAALAEIEESAARPAGVVEPTEDVEGDQLQAMRRALRAKFSPAPAPSPAVTDDDLQRARDEVQHAQDRADDAALQLSTTRRRIEGFETELTARINDGDARGARHEAALALEAQVSSVERQLSEAEAAARTEVDDATRATSRIELTLERDRQEARDRRRQLRELLSLVPVADRPSPDDDLVLHAGTVASALRDLVAPMQRDVDHARNATELLRAEHDAKTIDLEHRRSRLGVVDREDRRSALQALVDGHRLVVLDGVVGMGHEELLAAVDIDAIETTTPVIVLTSDPDVAAWAIDLPADRGRIVHASELWSLVEVDLTATEPSTAADQHPEPSPSR